MNELEKKILNITGGNLKKNVTGGKIKLVYFTGGKRLFILIYITKQNR
jgi:hypothetical protein